MMNRKWFDTVNIIRAMTLCGIICFTSGAYAQTEKSIEERSFELQAIIKNSEPDFLVEGVSARSHGAYLGTGFRNIQLEFSNGQSLFNDDNNVNGGIFNLGYFTNDNLFEYSRHVSIFDKKGNLSYQEHEADFIYVVQNNFWFFISNRFSSNLYFHYGVGIQASEVILRESSTFSALQRESSLLVGGGVSYFFNPNYFVHYRIAQGLYSSELSTLITGENEENILNSSRVQTIFFQYFVPL